METQLISEEKVKKTVQMSTPNIDIILDLEENILTVTWRKNTLGDEYRLAYVNIAKLALQYKCKKLLINQQLKDGITLAADMDWMTKEWLPAFIAKGGKDIKVSVILSTNAFAEFSARKLNQQIKSNEANNAHADSKFHKTKEEGMAWLRSFSILVL